MATKRISFKRLQEAELRSRIKAGGRLKGAIIVGRRDALGPYYVVYLSTNWRRGLHPLQVTQAKKLREFRDLVRLIEHIRGVYKYREPLTIYEAGCPALRNFRGVLPEDREPGAETSGDEASSPADAVEYTESEPEPGDEPAED